MDARWGGRAALKGESGAIWLRHRFERHHAFKEATYPGQPAADGNVFSGEELAERPSGNIRRRTLGCSLQTGYLAAFLWLLGAKLEKAAASKEEEKGGKMKLAHLCKSEEANL